MMVGADRVALNIIFEGLVFMVLSNTREKYLLQNNIPNSRLECKNHTQFMTKMARGTGTGQFSSVINLKELNRFSLPKEKFKIL